MSVKIIDVTQRYPLQDQPLYQNFNAEFSANKVHVILGASGTGKTTLLNIISGLCDYKGKTECGSVSFAFQDDRLLENITVANNLKLILNGVYKDKKKVSEQIEKVLGIAEILPYKDKFPYELSGGERQRVALARAFAYPSQTLLMDESFKSLDYGTKARLIKQFILLLDAMPRTVLFVTHDADEALSVADEVYLLQNKPVCLTHIATLTDDKHNRDVLTAEYVQIKKNIISKLM